MKVSELSEKLKSYPPDAEVIVFHDEDDLEYAVVNTDMEDGVVGILIR